MQYTDRLQHYVNMIKNKNNNITYLLGVYTDLNRSIIYLFVYLNYPFNSSYLEIVFYIEHEGIFNER